MIREYFLRQYSRYRFSVMLNVKMKMFRYIILVFLISSCQNQEVKKLDVPWYISERIKTGDIENYNFMDSLSKYKIYQDFKLSNKAKYNSYITDLEFKTKNKSKSELIKQIDYSYNENKEMFCNKLIAPSLEYVKPIQRPDRRYSKPYVIDLDFDYFIKRCMDCKLLSDSIALNMQIGKLKLSNIMLKDQWYRIPNRIMNQELQTQYDNENRKELDKIYTDNFLKLNDKEIRSNIYILLLHSDDCEWTRKWLRIYFKHCSNYEKYIDNLNHFLWRSSCKDEETVKMVKVEIKNH